MDTVDFLLLSLSCGAPLMAATIFIPGVIVGLGTALIARTSFPGLTLNDLPAIALSWVAALLVGGYVGSLVNYAVEAIVAAIAEGGIPSFYLVLLYAIPLAAGGSIAGAIGTGVTFSYLRRAHEIKAIDAA